MTAAEHFEKGEQLLAESADNEGQPELSLAIATRAQGHLLAARLLLDIQVSSVSPGSGARTAAWRAGLDTVADKRSAH